MDFSEFMDKEVKVCYKDFQQERIARGVLVSHNPPLLKIRGNLGTIIINENSIIKMGLGKQ